MFRLPASRGAGAVSTGQGGNKPNAARRRRDRAGGGGPSAGDYRHSILSTELLEPMNYRREGIPKEACSGRAPGEGALTRILGARSTSSPQRGGSVSERGRAPRTARVASGAPDLRLLGAVVKIETCNTLTGKDYHVTILFRDGGARRERQKPRGATHRQKLAQI